MAFLFWIVLTQLMSDQGYWAMVSEGMELFIEGL
jgi:hypothetical protein